jgi:hypothetical protein
MAADDRLAELLEWPELAEERRCCDGEPPAIAFAAMACWCPVSLLGLPLLWRVLPGGAATISRRYPDGFTG